MIHKVKMNGPPLPLTVMFEFQCLRTAFDQLIRILKKLIKHRHAQFAQPSQMMLLKGTELIFSLLIFAVIN